MVKQFVERLIVLLFLDRPIESDAINERSYISSGISTFDAQCERIL